MAVAYLDSSVMVSIRFGEAEAARLSEEISTFDELISSNLLESEYRAAHAREEREVEPERLSGIRWILPERPLSSELARVFSIRYLRGADAWHLATALSVVDEPSELAFITLDTRQRAVAESLGFRT